MKINKNQNGFSAIETILVLVVILVVIVAGYFVYKHHHKSSTPMTKNSDNASTSSDWLSYTSKNGDFSAYFPTSPNFNQSPIAPNSVTRTENGVNVVISSVISSNDINTTYSVTSVVSPNNTTLPNVSSSFPTYLNKHIVNLKSTNIGGRSAETFEFTAIRKAQPITALGRPETIPATPVYVVGEIIISAKTTYDVIAEHTGDTPAQYAHYFLKSFKLNN